MKHVFFNKSLPLQASACAFKMLSVVCSNGLIYYTMIDQSFFITSMPSSRPADYYLGYLDGCVFLDFNNCEDGKVRLIRISFDGYGCCNLGEDSVPLDAEDSKSFKIIINEGIKDQNFLLRIVKNAIKLNKEVIWKEALEEYYLT